MQFRPFLVILLGSTFTVAPHAVAQVADIEAAHKTPVEAKFLPNGQIRIDVCPSAARVVGTNDDSIRVSYNAPDGNDSDVKVRIKVEGERAGIKVSGCPRNNFHLNIEVPASSDLYARMFAGQMNVDNLSGNKDVELHFGQLTMEVGKAEDYRHVEASVMSGDLQASAFNVSKGGLFRSFDQDGPGKFRIHAHVGAGQIDLR
jgi:hypothetical protein